MIRFNLILCCSVIYINKENEFVEYIDVEDFIFIFEYVKVKRVWNI